MSRSDGGARLLLQICFLMKQYDFFVPTIENRDEFWIRVCFNFCSD